MKCWAQERGINRKRSTTEMDMEGTTEPATHRTLHDRADTTEESRKPEHEHERVND